MALVGASRIFGHFHANRLCPSGKGAWLLGAYQRALAARRPKPHGDEAVELQWKNVVGFNKIVVAGA
jgi:hypothetical protein